MSSPRRPSRREKWGRRHAWTLFLLVGIMLSLFAGRALAEDRPSQLSGPSREELARRAGRRAPPPAGQHELRSERPDLRSFGHASLAYDS